MRYHERMIMLSVIDSQWKDHLRDMDHLKEGIGLRGYGQHDPLVEYKRESFDMFEAMMQRFQEETVRYLYLMQILERPDDGGGARSGADGGPGGTNPDLGLLTPKSGGDGNGNRPPRNVSTSVDEIEEAFQRRKKRELDQARMAGSGDMQTVQQVVRGGDKIGRNDPCPCGSGKKYKKCCGGQGLAIGVEVGKLRKSRTSFVSQRQSLRHQTQGAGFASTNDFTTILLGCTPTGIIVSREYSPRSNFFFGIALLNYRDIP